MGQQTVGSDLIRFGSMLKGFCIEADLLLTPQLPNIAKILNTTEQNSVCFI